MNESLASKIGYLLVSLEETMTFAESCTGGGLGYALTSTPGSSDWLHQGVVTYDNSSKTALLGVDETLLKQFGAVSEEAVLRMLNGALEWASADCGVAVSGIAGPGGEVDGKPVGTVCIAWGGKDDGRALTYLYTGNRQLIRQQAITQSLLNILQYLRKKHGAQFST